MWILPLAVHISPAQQEPKFASRANLVSVPALVCDASGAAVYGLHATDFVIEDDGVAQIMYLDEASHAEPLSLMIAVERGRRASREFGRIATLASMLDPILSDPENEAACFYSTASLISCGILRATPVTSRHPCAIYSLAIAAPGYWMP